MAYLAKDMGVSPVLIPDLGREISPMRDLKVYSALMGIIRDFRPHIIHTHTAKAGTLGRLAGLSRNIGRPAPKIRMVHTFHGHVFHSYFNKIKTAVFIQIERALSRATDRVIVISRRQKEEICGRYRIAQEDKVSVVPLGLDLSSCMAPRQEGNSLRKRYLSDVPESGILVGIVGRLTPVKNHRMLLDAMAYLKRAGKLHRFKFLVVGDGELRMELEKYAEEIGVRGQVCFTGWIRDVASVYKALDVLVLTSLNEGTPVSLIEGMASGIPVIATDVGGVRDLMGVIDNESGQGYKEAQHGFLVSSGDSEAMGKILIDFLQNPQRQQILAQRARDFVLKQYSLDRLVRDLDGLYRELVGWPLSGQEG